MAKYIHEMDDFPDLFEKLDYKEEKLGIPYTAMMIDVIKKERMKKFSHFLLEELQKSDTIFHYSKTRFMIIFEGTAIRGAILINEKIRKKAKKSGLKFKFYSSAIQGYSVEDIESLEKSLKKRLKRAKDGRKEHLIHSLSCLD